MSKEELRKEVLCKALGLAQSIVNNCENALLSGKEVDKEAIEYQLEYLENVAICVDCAINKH